MIRPAKSAALTPDIYHSLSYDPVPFSLCYVTACCSVFLLIHDPSRLCWLLFSTKFWSGRNAKSFSTAMNQSFILTETFCENSQDEKMNPVSLRIFGSRVTLRIIAEVQEKIVRDGIFYVETLFHHVMLRRDDRRDVFPSHHTLSQLGSNTQNKYYYHHHIFYWILPFQFPVPFFTFFIRSFDRYVTIMILWWQQVDALPLSCRRHDAKQQHSGSNFNVYRR